MARLGVVEIDQLPTMQVLETLDAEKIISDRMAEFVDLWKQSDPPAGAVYDVDGLEFDPIKITQEASAYFELLLRDRVNQAAKAVTLAFASGSDLDAIGSRYPGGMPRLPGESDSHYRMRVWLSPNTLTKHGVYEGYVFWAMTARPELRDVTAVADRGTPNVTVTIMADGVPVTVTDGKVTSFPSPLPSADQIDAVLAYVNADSRRGLTDVVMVRAPEVVKVNYKIRYWLYPGWDQAMIEPELMRAMAALIEKQRWLGFSHTQSAVEAALMVSGVFNVIVDSPADTMIEPHQVVQVESVTLTFAGRGGFEAPTEPT